jgi:hypothetical protein
MMRRQGKEEELRERLEIARWQMFLAMQMHPYIKPQKKAKTPHEWIAFAWDKEDERPIPEDAGKVTQEEKDAFKRLYEEYIAR